MALIFCGRALNRLYFQIGDNNFARMKLRAYIQLLGAGSLLLW
jgi:hypothetical protein